jgi:hypothetical protein
VTSTRNISGKITAKKTDILSRTNPLVIARDIALNAVALLVMGGTPAR